MGEVTLIGDKIDFKIKYITRDKKGNFIIAKYQENITIWIFMQIITELQYIQVKINKEIDKSTLMIRDF